MTENMQAGRLRSHVRARHAVPLRLPYPYPFGAGGSSPSGAAEPRSQGGGIAARAVRTQSVSSRAARRTASGEGTAQPPFTRVPFSLGTFFWASKRKCHARRAEKATVQSVSLWQ